MPKIEPFEKYREEYEQWFHANRYVYLSELQAVKHFIPDGEKGIEIGVGTGLFADPLHIQYGVEPSKKMAELAKQRGITVYPGVAEKLPIQNETYDFALMVTSVCFVDDVLQSFKEIHRILHPKGRVIIAVVDKESPIGKIYLEHKEKNKFYKNATFFSTKEILNLLEKSQFQDVEIIQTVFGMINEIKEKQKFKEGFGEGSFVVIKAIKGDAYGND